MTSQHKDGGPAFPQFEMSDDGTGYCTDPGMSKRDEFAARALENLASMHNGQAVDPHGTARVAYEYADAMLAAREEGARQHARIRALRDALDCVIEQKHACEERNSTEANNERWNEAIQCADWITEDIQALIDGEQNDGS